MTKPLLPSPPLPFRTRFDSSSPPALTPSPLGRNVAWPDDDDEETPNKASTSQRRASLPHFSKVKTDKELYIAALEQQMYTVKSKSDPSLVKAQVPAVSPSRLTELALADSVTSDEEEDSLSTDEEDETSSDTEDELEDTRPLIPHHRNRSSLSSTNSTPRRSRSPSRRRSLTPSAPPNSGASGRIAFAPVVRIGAGIRSLASSYTYPSAFPSRPGTSRSTSPASSIYAPLLPGPGIAPGAVFRQANKPYGALPLQGQLLESNEGSPYRQLLEQQRAKKRNRKRRKQWARFRRRVLEVLCWPLACCRSRVDEEDLL